MIRGRRILGAGDRFSFGCHPGLPCFTECCGDIQILLTPVDVVRLARRLGIGTGDFLDAHTRTPITRDLNLPVVMLKMGDDERRRCPFVGEQGCTVYEDRPWACRMYPIGMGLPPARAGEAPEPVYFLFEDDFCKGAGEAKAWTVAEWKEHQGVLGQEAIEEGFSGIVSHPWFIGGRQLDPKRIEMYHTACFDLDRFRSFVFDSTFLSRFEVPEEEQGQIATSDLALLRFAFRWLKFALFAEPTMNVRGSPTARPRRSP